MLASAQVSALTLGRMRGGALLGKELDVAVLVQLAPDEAASPPCFDAAVNYGENLVDSGRVTVKPLPGPQANTQWIRITSSARVDDAVVSVNLKAGCGHQASRRYMLLADVLTDPAADSPSQAAAMAPAAVAASSAKAGAAETSPVPPAAAQAKPRAVQTVPPRKVDAVSSLKLAPPATAAVRQAPAKASSSLNTAAVEDLQRRVDDIEKWQASSTVAEQLQKSEQRTQALEANLKDLQAVTAKNMQSLQVVTATLENSASQNQGRMLLYTLAALVVVCLAGLAYVFMRMRAGAHAKPWWSDHAERAGTSAPAALAASAPASASPLAPAASIPPARVPTANAVQSQQAPDAPISALPEVDLDIGLDHADAAPSLPQPVLQQPQAAVAQASRPDFAQSGHASIKAINTKEMLDVRQQAEFFMALGQHDEAVRLLESSIQGSADANPMVYLDLLKIFHTLSRRTEFERYREEFNQQFTGRVPGYSSFLIEGNGLDAYEDICQQIVVLWPTDYTIDFIEQCLVRTPEDDPEQGIDMEAFKDLLLLYGVLKRLDQTLDSAMVPFSASRTANSQLGMVDGIAVGTAAQAGTAAAAPLPSLTTPGSIGSPAGADLELDLDLELPVTPDDAKVEPPAHDNLINFDISGFDLPQDSKPKN